jgi:hypothetical protein
MKIADIQHAVSGCCAVAGSNASKATAWIGHNVQAFGSTTAGAAKTVGSATWNTATKVTNITMAYLGKAAMVTSFYTQVAWQGAKNLSAQAWDVAKITGSKTAALATVAGNRILCGTKAAVQVTANVASTVVANIKIVASKIAAVASNAFAKTALFVKEAAIAGKNGVVQGFQASRTFVVAHQKETLIIGGIVAVTLAIGYAARNVYNRSSELTA